MTELRAAGLTVRTDGVTILEDVSLTVCSGELVALLGPNGAGKSTLLRALLGLARQATGTVTVDGVPVASLSAAARARRMAYLPQHRPLAWPSPVIDVVALGRYAHGAAPGRLGEEDARAVDAALAACDLDGFARRATDSLSGGELARVHLARALASRADLLLADEPVAELDPRHQLRTAGHIRHFVDAGGGALIVLHDVALAARIADRLVFLRQGRIASDGPAGTLSAKLMADVFGVRARVMDDGRGIDVRIDAAL